MIPDEGNYCNSFSERSSENNYGIGKIKSEEQTLYEPNGNVSSAVFILVVTPAVFIILGVAILVVYRNLIFGNGTNSFSYTPVAFDNNSSVDELFIEEEEDEEASENEANNN